MTCIVLQECVENGLEYLNALLYRTSCTFSVTQLITVFQKFNKLCFPETTNRITIETVQGNPHISFKSKLLINTFIKIL